MVATARQRKTEGETSTNVTDPRLASRRNADGRRQLFGLSQAIREKAFQSTSPSCEANQQNNPTPRRQSPRQEGNDKKKPEASLTIEERFKNLFNSDTEGRDEKKYKKKNNSILSSRRCKTPGPSTKTSMRDDTSLKEQEKAVIFNEENQIISHNFNQPYYRQSPASNQSYNQPQRRCVSAVPAVFNEQDWNKVPPSPKNMQSTQNRINMALGPQPFIHYRTSQKSSSAPHPRPCSTGTPLAMCYQKDPPQNHHERPVPAVRKSLCFDKNNKPQSARLTFDNSSSPGNFSMRLGPSVESQNRSSPHGSKPHFIHSTPVLNQADIAVGLNESEHCSGYRHMSSKQADITYRANQTHVRRCITPSPGNQNNKIDQFSGRHSSPNNATHNQSNLPLSFQAGKTNDSKKEHYPQQNFSFRRAVRRSVSSDSEKCMPSDTKCPLNSYVSTASGGDKCSRKSDDRDSGTVVEPEASVFDFDSSVLSDGKETKDVQFANNSSTFKNEWSRSSTPILPLLSSDDENCVESQIQQTEAEVYTQHTLQQKHTQNNVKNGKPENKVKPLRRVEKEDQNTENNSFPTGKTLPINQQKKNDQRNAKVLSSKLQRGSPEAKKWAHNKGDANHEQKRSSSRHRRFIEESDVTDSSLQIATYKSLDGRLEYYDPSYQSSYRVTKERSELGETSSVRSITTTSVCSSVLRKTGSRRHSRRYISGEKHSREVRSMAKRFSRLESHVVLLARSLTQLSTELRQSNVTSREISQLRLQMQELQAHQMQAIPSKARKPLMSMTIKGGNQPKMNKLEKFFGEQPPLLNLFLKQLGYQKYIKNFEQESIGMMELPYMDEKRLRDIGIPLGPRLRIMKEAQKSSYV